MPNGKVLVAEDNPELMRLFELKFGAAGFIVCKAADGEQAIEALRAEPPDVALLDVNLPKADGFQILQEFPKEKRNFPIIMLTNAADDQSKLRAEELGADGYHIKHSENLSTLVDMVKNLERFS